MRSNYKTTECYFFAQNRCTRGDNCTFKHGDNDHLAPPKKIAPVWCVSMPRTDKEEEVELVKNLKFLRMY